MTTKQSSELANFARGAALVHRTTMQELIELNNALAGAAEFLTDDQVYEILVKMNGLTHQLGLDTLLSRDEVHEQFISPRFDMMLSEHDYKAADELVGKMRRM